MASNKPLNEFEGLGGDENNVTTSLQHKNLESTRAERGDSSRSGFADVDGLGQLASPMDAPSGDLAASAANTIFEQCENGIVGWSFADTLSGSNNGFSSSEVFDGGAGNDTFDGRGGFDQAVYNFDLGTAVGRCQ